MDVTETTLTVLFEEPFWVGVFERSSGKGYEVCRVVFGAEPKAAEIYRRYLQQGHRLNFSPAVVGGTEVWRRVNPKRLQRQAKREVESRGVGTKAQQALQMQREQHKQERRAVAKEQKAAEAQRKFQLRQERKKQKHRGH